MDPANLRGRDVGPKLGVGGGDDAPALTTMFGPLLVVRVPI